MWSLMGDLSVQVDVLICSDVCVAAGNIHFLSFIWVNGEGLGGLSKAPYGCGIKPNPQSYLGTSSHGSFSDGTTPYSFCQSYTSTQFTSLLFQEKIYLFLLFKRCQDHRYWGTSFLYPSLAWMWVISDPEQHHYPQHTLHIKAEKLLPQNNTTKLSWTWWIKNNCSAKLKIHAQHSQAQVPIHFSPKRGHPRSGS